MLLGQAHEFVHTIRRFVGQADVAHLACFDQLGQGFELFVNRGDRLVFGRIEIGHAKDRGMALGPVDLVEVDHIGLQAAQAAVAGGQDVLPGQARAFADPGHATGRARHLGRQHQFFAGTGVLSEPVANKGFGRATGVGRSRHGIHLGRVNEVDARFERTVQDGVRIGFTHLLAEGHGAQANRGHLQVGLTELNEFHGVSFVEFKPVGFPRGEKYGDGLILSRVNARGFAALSRVLLPAAAAHAAAPCPWWSWAAGR